MAGARLAGGELYYAHLQREMDDTGLPQWEAELSLLYSIVYYLRTKQHKTHREIAAHLEASMGLKAGCYRSRLKRLRQRYLIP